MDGYLRKKQIIKYDAAFVHLAVKALFSFTKIWNSKDQDFINNLPNNGLTSWG